MLTAQDILDEHLRIMQEGGEGYDQRPIDAPCVDKAIGLALQGACYLSDRPGGDPLHVAALLLYYLARDHCFFSGNKRIAWATTVRLMLMQGLRITATHDEAVAFVTAIAENRYRRDQIINWLAEDGRLIAYE